MTTGGNNSYIGKKYGDMFKVVPMPLEVTQSVMPCAVINPPFFPVIVSAQHRGLPRPLDVTSTTQNGAGTVIVDHTVPVGHYYRLFSTNLIRSGGTHTLTNFSIQVIDPVTNTWYFIASTTDFAGAYRTDNFPNEIILPEGWVIRAAIVVSAATNAVYHFGLFVQDWTAEDQSTVMREGLN
jgi:hypothetical protein